MIRPILRYGAGVLHAAAEPVAEITPDVQQLIDDMIQTMYAAPGIGLAATQVGVPLRIFVVDLSVGRDPSGLITMINPVFVERDGTQLEEEGCLSLPGFTATVLRPQREEAGRPDDAVLCERRQWELGAVPRVREGGVEPVVERGAV